jgi:superfamily II DNA or RNA helicase
VARIPLIEPGETVRVRDQRWRVARCIGYGDTVILDVGGCDTGNRGVRAKFVLPIERVERLPVSRTPRIVGPARWRAVARLELGEAVPRIDSLRAAARANVSAIPFQLEPALAITRGLGCRMLIADDVGLGKTIQAGMIIAEALVRVPDGRTLVVCPAALRDQWLHEMEQRFGLRASILDSTTAARAPHVSPGTNPWAAHSLVITSVDYVKRPEVIRSLESLIWDVAVFDEAHALSGGSARAAAATALAKRSRVVVMLSATPHSGDDAAFARLCALGELPGEPPLLLFRRTRKDAGLSVARRTTWFRVRTSAAELEMHRALEQYARLVCAQHGDRATGGRLAMTVLVKRACSSAASLARSLERRLLLLTHTSPDFETQLGLPFEHSEAADEEPLAALATAGLGDLSEERGHLQRILALARDASIDESKLRALQRLLRRSGEPTIIFTEYRDTLARIASALPDDVKAVRLHGGLTSLERRDALREFTCGSARLLLATDAASEGLNLHHRCRLVVNLELPWSPLRLEQRVGRVDRIGQPARVHALYLVGGATAEQHTVSRLLERMVQAGSALSEPAVTGEEEIAGAVLGFRLTPLNPHRRNSPLVRSENAAPDLRSAAIQEANRVATARSLLQHAAREPDTRPFVTVLRRRSRHLSHRCYWAFRVSVTDSVRDVLWRSVVAVETTTPPLRTADVIRAVTEMASTAVERAVRDRHPDLLAGCLSLAEQCGELCRARERRISGELERTRARLTGSQRGLFDRRAERVTAAQSAVLDEALERCASRLRDLHIATPLTVGPLELVFAVSFG